MRRKLWTLAVVIALIAGTAAVAAATSSSTDLAGGDQLTVNCTGGGRLSQQRLSRTSIADTCNVSSSSTTSTSTSTTSTSTTTTEAPTTTTSGGGGGFAECTSDPQGNLGAYSYAGITNSNGYNTYVANQVWAPQPGTTSTVCANNPGDWTLETRTTQDQGGAVQSYPDVQQLENNWTGNGWGPCGACSDTPINRLASLSSHFDITDPPTSQGAWWAAYDLWTSSGELMIVTTGSDFRLANNGATVIDPDVVIGGQHWTDMQYGGPGGLPQLVLHGNPSSGNIDVLSILNYWQLTGRLSTSATLGQMNYGWEVCSTNGATLDFAVNGYTITQTAA